MLLVKLKLKKDYLQNQNKKKQIVMQLKNYKINLSNIIFIR